MYLEEETKKRRMLRVELRKHKDDDIDAAMKRYVEEEKTDASALVREALREKLGLKTKKDVPQDAPLH